MPRIDNEKAAKAREFIYSGEAFKETETPLEEYKAVEKGEEVVRRDESPESVKRLDEARSALFDGKLFK